MTAPVVQQWAAPLRTWWGALAVREQRALRWAAWVVLAGLVWWVLLAPALQTLQRAPAQRQALEQSLRTMRQWQAQAQTLQALPTPRRAEVEQSLQLLASRLGNAAQMSVVADQATLTLKSLPARDLAFLLSSLQSPGMPAVEQLQLTQTQQAWSGQVMVRMPSGTGLPNSVRTP